MKKLLPLLCSLLLCGITISICAQEYNFGSTTYYYRLPNDSLVSSGLYLDLFNYNGASRTNDSLFTDGIYFPASDCFGRNLWIRLRHIAEDPNGTNRGINISATANSPCPFGDRMLGGWAGFLYDFEIHRDDTLVGNRANLLGPLFPTSITVASLETLSGSCGGAEWLSFMIVNSGSTGWQLNSINFTGNNTASNPGFSDSMAVYTTGGCTPPDGFSYTFPTGADSISFISASCCGYSEFKMSAGSLSHFQYGYEYSGGSGGYQGMSMAFGSAPTYTLSGQDVTCKNGYDGAINVAINGGIGPFIYQWSDSTASGQGLTNLTSGTYRLTVIDQNGCGKIADTAVVIHEPTGVTVSVDSVHLENVSCYNGNDGSLLIFASGVSPITYQWSNGSNQDSLKTGLSAFIYFITISDSHSCIVSTDTINQPDPIDTSTSLTVNTITANATGATYQWLNCNGDIITDSTSASITPQLSGSYKVVITKNGCTDTSSCINVNIVSGIEELSPLAFSISPNPASDIVMVTLNKAYPQTEISITDLNGIIICSKTETNKTTIPLSLQQPAGIYFITLKTNEGKTVKKLVVE